jgi:hypothetical protein
MTNVRTAKRCDQHREARVFTNGASVTSLKINYESVIWIHTLTFIQYPKRFSKTARHVQFLLKARRDYNRRSMQQKSSKIKDKPIKLA